MNKHVIKANYATTGGGVMTYWGELDNGKYIVFSTLGVFQYLNSDYGETMTQEFFDKTDGDTYEWDQEHVLKTIEEPFGEEEKRLIKETYDLLDIKTNELID